MSEENVEVVRRFADTFNAFMRGELAGEAFAETLHSEIEMHWHDRQTYPDTPQHLRGPRGVIRFAEQYRSTWDDLAMETVEFTEAADDRVLVFIRQSARGRESGVPIVIHFFEVFTIGNGKVRKIEYFRHRAEAREAAGLRE